MAGQLGGFIVLVAMVVLAGPAFFAGLLTAKIIRSVPWMLTHPIGAITSLVLIVVAILLFVGPIVGIAWIVKRRPQR